MRVVVKLFGEFREAAGGGLVELELPPGTTCELALQRLAVDKPKLRRLLFHEGVLRDHLHVFVNGRNVHALRGLATPLSEGDALAFFPPVGGG